MRNFNASNGSKFLQACILSVWASGMGLFAKGN